jgi:hypothetical protein
MAEERRKPDHSIAVWAGFTAFFSNLAAVSVVTLLGKEGDVLWAAVGVLVTSTTIGLAVYARQRLNDARGMVQRRERAP